MYKKKIEFYVGQDRKERSIYAEYIPHDRFAALFISVNVMPLLIVLIIMILYLLSEIWEQFEVVLIYWEEACLSVRIMRDEENVAYVTSPMGGAVILIRNSRDLRKN